MKRTLIRTTRMSPAALALLAGTALGGPEGERVVAGDASFDRAGASTTITAGNNAIIEYNSFNIGAGESVRFVQPGADARVLNRVLGASPTRIDGSLTANGRVYLVNEAGVFFGTQAVVNAGAIHAAAGTMTTQDFLGGVDRFGNLSGEVRNEGLIEAGEIHFAGRRVTNLGDLSAEGGLVTMTAGDEVYIGRRDGHVFVRAEGGQSAASGAIDQGGSVDAGRVLIGAGDMFSIAMRSSSSLRADEVRIESAGEGTVHVRGAIDASSDSGVGGSVAVTGEGVAVLDATIDASGPLGGGQILIGGGYRGDTSMIGTSSRVYVSDEANLRADGFGSDGRGAGDGGTVVAWADDAVVFEGNVSIRGGSLAGDGGRAEVSSPRFLSFEGRVDGSAANGKRGSLLIDPDNIAIADGLSGVGDSLLDDNQIPVTEAPGLDLVVTTAALESIGDVSVLLEAAETIRITNISDGSLDFEATDGQTITFSAGERFFVEDGISLTTQGGGISVVAGDTIELGGVDARGGRINLRAGMRIDAPARVVSDGGIISYAVTGGSRTASIGNTEARFIGFNLDTIELTGTLIGQAAMDLTGITTITVPANTGATIGAVSGVDTFEITLDPSVMLTGPGGLRFVGSRITLPAVSGLSELEVTATEELTLTGDIQLNNGDDGLGGRVDLREAVLVTLMGDIRIDTDITGPGDAGEVLLNGAAISGTGSTLTIDTNNNDTDAETGLIALGDVDVDELVLFGGPVELSGALGVQTALGFNGVSSVTTVGDASISTNGQNLSFAGLTLDGPGGLAIDLNGGSGAGTLLLDLAVGATTALSSFEVSGNTFSLPEVTTTGLQLYTSPTFINLDGDLTSTESGSITFDAGVAFDSDREITTAGAMGDNIEFLRSVFGTDASLTTSTALGSTVFDRTVEVDALSVNGSTELRGASLSVQSDLVLGENADRDTVTLTQTDSLVRSRSGDVIFRSDVQGARVLRVAVDPTVTGSDVPVIRFENSVGSETPLSMLVLGSPDATFFGGTRTDVPGVATVVAGRFDADGVPVSGRTFSFNTTGDFVMNSLEKLTALGSLEIDAGGTARIGDINTVDNLTITSPDILINTRVGGDLFAVDTDADPENLLPAGATTDFGVDFVVGGSAALNGPVRLSDASLAQPTIAEPGGKVRIENVLTRAPQVAVTADDLTFDRRTGTGGGAMSDETTVLDFRAAGATTVPLAVGLTPEGVETQAAASLSAALASPQVIDAQASSAVGGIGLRHPTQAEYASEARGAALYVDMPASLGRTDELSVVTARVGPDAANAFGGAWNRLAAAMNESPADADAVLGKFRGTLAIAAERYEDTTGASINDADAFSLFTSIRGAQSDAARGLELVAAVLRGVRSLGLSESETERIELAIIEGIRPASLDRGTVRSLVESASGNR